MADRENITVKLCALGGEIYALDHGMSINPIGDVSKEIRFLGCDENPKCTTAFTVVYIQTLLKMHNEKK